MHCSKLLNAFVDTVIFHKSELFSFKICLWIGDFGHWPLCHM